MRPVCHPKLSISVQFGEARDPSCTYGSRVAVCQSAALPVRGEKSDAYRSAERPPHVLTENDVAAGRVELSGDANHRHKPNDPKGFKSGAGRGNRTPKGRSPADFESAASASSAIPAFEWHQ